MLTTGEVGRAMADDMARHGGLVTHRDLAEYSPSCVHRCAPAVGDWDLAVNPPPSVGGPCSRSCSDASRRGNFTWSDVIEIQRAVLRYRADVHDVAPDLDTAGHEPAAHRRPPRAGRPADEREHGEHLRRRRRRHGLRGHGLEWLRRGNHGAGHRDPAQQRPRRARARTGSGCTGWLPARGSRPTWRPDDGAHPDGRVLAIGSPGADRITTALMQVLGQGCLHDADLQHAIDAPRLHVRFGPTAIPVVEHETDAAIARPSRTPGCGASTTG